MAYTMGSLFAGIGGFDLGFERAGFKTVWQVEIDPYCQKVLAKNFPEAERFGDIRECGRHNLKPVDVICGGFPCQDISNAGKRAGIEGERSGLWSEYARILRELRPRFALIENVAALANFGMDRVLCDLATIGFDAEWQVISAADMGAHHLRRRIWILANDSSQRCGSGWPWGSDSVRQGESKQPLQMANTPRIQQGRQEQRPERERVGMGSESITAVADSELEQWDRWGDWSCGWEREPEEALRDARGGGREEAWMSIPESLLGRVAHGVPAVVDRLRGLCNAVVPQIPEMIARRIKQALDSPAVIEAKSAPETK